MVVRLTPFRPRDRRQFSLLYQSLLRILSPSDLHRSKRIPTRLLRSDKVSWTQLLQCVVDVQMPNHRTPQLECTLTIWTFRPPETHISRVQLRQRSGILQLERHPQLWGAATERSTNDCRVKNGFHRGPLRSPVNCKHLRGMDLEAWNRPRRRRRAGLETPSTLLSWPRSEIHRAYRSPALQRQLLRINHHISRSCHLQHQGLNSLDLLCPRQVACCKRRDRLRKRSLKIRLTISRVHRCQRRRCPFCVP